MSIFDTIREFLVSPEHEAAVEEEVTILEELATTKIELWKNVVDKMFLDPTAAESQGQVVGTKRSKDFQRYDVSTTENVNKAINDAVNSLFDFSLDGLKSAGLGLIKTGIATLLGDYSGTASSDTVHQLMPQASGILRVDSWMWRHKFSSGGLLTQQKEVYAMYVVTSPINLKKVASENPEVITGALNDLVKNLPADKQHDAMVKQLQDWKTLWKQVGDGSDDDDVPPSVAHRANRVLDRIDIPALAAAAREQ